MQLFFIFSWKRVFCVVVFDGIQSLWSATSQAVYNGDIHFEQHHTSFVFLGLHYTHANMIHGEY